MKTEKFEDGLAICGDCNSQEAIDEIKNVLGDSKLKAVITDPPYGNIINEEWDKWYEGQKNFVNWMMGWTNTFSDLLIDGGAMYVWGGYGIPCFRPFFEYAHRVEYETPMRIANLITWQKKRAYGIQHNYLSTREEILYMVKGNIKKPATFNVPYLDTKRGYAGYNTKYPAKSEYYRRNNVWTGITEIFSGKLHPTQKPLQVFEIPILANTDKGDWIMDPFAGSFTAAYAARNLSRNWICIERDETIFESAITAMKSIKRKR